jgi:hypothetical protein
MDDIRFTVDFDHDDIIIRDRAGAGMDPNRIDHGQVQFDAPASFIEQIVKVARHYATMRELTSGIDAVWGAPMVEDGNVVGYIDGLPQYRFTSAPCFTNLDTITIDRTPTEFGADWTDVIIWDDGRGITFLAEDDVTGCEIVFGTTKHDLEMFLEAQASTAPSL